MYYGESPISPRVYTIPSGDGKWGCEISAELQSIYGTAGVGVSGRAGGTSRLQHDAFEETGGGVLDLRLEYRNLPAEARICLTVYVARRPPQRGALR